MHITWVSLLVLAGVVPAYQLPAGLNQIYQTHKSGECKNVLRGGFSDGNSGNDVSYCGDIDGAIFLHTSSNAGAYADMDVDCDGADNGAGACSNDPSGQGQTAFKDEVSQYGISDLNANIHPYVVFGNDGSSPSFDPKKYGMQPLGVMAVVCNGQLHYGIWGDTNGGISTGEASLSLAKLCFPNDNITGDNGHREKDVLYIGFTSKDSVPGSEADWHAKDSKAFEESIKSLGDRLVAKLTGTAVALSSTPIPSSASFPAWSTISPPTPSMSSGVPSPSSSPGGSTPVPSWTPGRSRLGHGWRPGSRRPIHA